MSYKSIFLVTLAQKNRDNALLEEDLKKVVYCVEALFNSKSLNYSIKFIENTSIEDKQGKKSFIVCYDTNYSSIIPAIDYDFDIVKLLKIMFLDSHLTSHFIILSNDMIKEKYVREIVSSYNEKYDCVLDDNCLIWDYLR